MNGTEKKYLTSVLKSKESYKKKSIKQTKKIRHLSLRLEETKKSRNKYKKVQEEQEKEIEKLKKENENLENLLKDSTKLAEEMKDKVYYWQYIVIQLVIKYMIGFRAVNRVLSTPLALNAGLQKSPSHVTVREWCLRFGLFLLNSVKTIEEKWVCIIDFTVQIGRAKAFIVLRLPLSNIKEDRAIVHTDVEVIGLKVANSFKGEDIKNCLIEIFSKSGEPIQIVTDGGTDLAKGIKLYNEGKDIHVTRDLTHLIAGYYKKEHKDNKYFKKFMDLIKNLRQKTQQTDLSEHTPPAFRQKSRFLNLTKIYEWSLAMIYWLEYKSKLKNKEEYKKTNKIFKQLKNYKDYLLKAYGPMKKLNAIMQIIKTEGVSENSIKKALNSSKYLPNKIKTILLEWFTDELEFSKKIGRPTLGNSDVIESIFGKYKDIVQPHSLSHINSSILLIPCICSKIEYETVEEAFENTKVNDVKEWTNKNELITKISKRKKILKNYRKKQKKVPDI